MTKAWIRDRLNEPKPGLSVQLQMAPAPRAGHAPYTLKKDDSKQAGVLLLLYPNPRNLNLLLTKRTGNVYHHRGQISFPGGQQDPGEDLLETSLRETREEMGIELSEYEILGRLTPLYIPPSNYCIFPTVAAVESRPDYSPQQAEVAEVIEVPLEHLNRPEIIHMETWTLHGQSVQVPFYLVGKHKIWGATAMVLAEFLFLLNSD